MKKIFSNLVDDMDICAYTGYMGRDIERHHVFGGANRGHSEFYGLVLPLAPWIHPNGARFDEERCIETTGMTRKEIDHHMKVWAQTWFELNVTGGHEEFIKVFGRSWKG